MNKSEFLATVWAARQEWDARVGQFPDDIPLPSGWSLKDVIYHVMWYEREMVGVLRAKALVGSPWWNQTLDERNAAILAESRPLAWPEVLAEARRVWQDLWALLQQVSDAELADASHFAHMPAGWKPWQVIASNTYEHYPQHFSMLPTASAPAGKD